MYTCIIQGKNEWKRRKPYPCLGRHWDIGHSCWGRCSEVHTLSGYRINIMWGVDCHGHF